MIKVHTTHHTTDRVDSPITCTYSIPNPTVPALLEVLRHIAWVATQKNPEIRVEG
jgi:hypothetical protein